MNNLYKILEIHPDATTEEIRSALILKHHLFDDEIKTQMKECLLNPQKRAYYDLQLKQHQPKFFGDLNEAQNNHALPPALPNLPKQRTIAHLNDDEAMPQLWNPTAAAALGLLVSILAMWIHAQNWRALGDEDMAHKNMMALYINIVFLLAILFAEMLAGITLPASVGIIPFAIWVALLGRHQIHYVKEHYQKNYEPKPWAKVILAGVAIFAGLVALAVLLSTLLGNLGLLHPNYWQE